MLCGLEVGRRAGHPGRIVALAPHRDALYTAVVNRLADATSPGESEVISWRLGSDMPAFRKVTPGATVSLVAHKNGDWLLVLQATKAERRAVTSGATAAVVFGRHLRRRLFGITSPAWRHRTPTATSTGRSLLPRTARSTGAARAPAEVRSDSSLWCGHNLGSPEDGDAGCEGTCPSLGSKHRRKPPRFPHVR
jgi:hypothetical protein